MESVYMLQYDFPRGAHYDPHPLDASVAFYPLALQGLNYYNEYKKHFMFFY